MSNQPFNLLDVTKLEELANELFGAQSIPQGVAGGVPGSVAGSGVSPSAVNQGNSVNLADPQTSLPDPHFAVRGHVPASVAGSGISPSARPGQYAEGVPGASIQRNRDVRPGDAEQRLTERGPDQATFQNWGGIEWTKHVPGAKGPGFPGAGQFSAEPAFYFLNRGAHDLSSHLRPEAANQVPYGGLPSPPFDVNAVRRDFPILHQQVNGWPLVWLDNAATTQKPWEVINAISDFYQHDNSNIHRAAHELAARSTDAYEGAREKVRKFLNAGSVNEIVFVRGTTEAINLVAKSWGAQHLQAGDEIIVSHLEHHANIVPWQQLAQEKGLKLRVIPVDDDGQILLDEYGKLLGPRTKLVSVTQVSNALGTITPVRQIVDMGHAVGAKVLIDGAQSVSHMPVDVRALNSDWFVFSGHKVFGPTGIGVLYGREELLNATNPWQGGGNMIKDVTFEHTTYHPAPGRFEAGTGNIADAVGLGAALDYVGRIGMEAISKYEHYLLLYATRLLKDVPGLRLIGTAADKAGVLSFVLDGFKTEEVGSALNKNGIAVRSGHHCAQPILRRFGLEATVRPSLALYNTCADIDALVATLHRLTTGRV